MLILAVIASTLLVWGAHGIVPPALADGTDANRRLWRLAALPAALGALLLALFGLAALPDLALAAGLVPLLPTNWTARAGAALIVLALLGDAALLVRAPRTPLDWRAAAFFGVGGAVGAAVLGELLRIGTEPTLWPAFVAGALCRLALALAAGEAFVARRPRFGLPAALALAVYPFVLPANTGASLLRSSDALTTLAAATLFAAARWLPARLRRPAIVGAALLAALVLTRAQLLSAAFTAQTPFTISVE